MKLTDRKKSSAGAQATDLLHIVKTGDTSQNSAGSSYKAEIGDYAQLFSDNFVRDLIITANNLPLNYTEQDVCDYILSLPAEQRTIAPTDSKWNIIITDAVS